MNELKKEIIDILVLLFYKLYLINFLFDSKLYLINFKYGKYI